MKFTVTIRAEQVKGADHFETLSAEITQALLAIEGYASDANFWQVTRVETPTVSRWPKTLGERDWQAPVE